MARNRKASPAKSAQHTQVLSIPEIQVFNTGIYVRLSVLDNGKADSDSIESQVDILEKYIAERPYLRFVKLYRDNGYSGTNFERPAWEELINDIQKGKINCVVVKDLSRLGRNYMEAGSLLEKEFPQWGVRFISVNDGYDSATLNSTEELTAALKNIVNDYYAKDISRKACSSLAAKRQKGDYIGSYAPYGYQKDPENKNRLIVDPVTAPVVRQIYLWRAAGDGYGTITRKLNEQGIPSPGRYRYEQGIITNNNKKGSSLLWNRHALKDLLRNIAYIGHLAQGKCRASLYAGIPVHLADKSEWDIAYNTHEPIIEEELFQMVQAVNEKQSTIYKSNYGKYAHLPKETNPYRKHLVCADCGTQLKLVRSIAKGGGKGYYSYVCPTFEEHKELHCSCKKSIRSNVIDTAVLTALTTQLQLFSDSQEVLNRLLAKSEAAAAKKRENPEIKRLEKELSSKEAFSVSLYDDWKSGLLTLDEYTFAKEKYQRQLSILRQQIQELKGTSAMTVCKTSGLKDWEKKIQQFRNPKEVTPALVDAFISLIRMSEGGSVTIEFRFEEEKALLASEIERLRREAV